MHHFLNRVLSRLIECSVVFFFLPISVHRGALLNLRLWTSSFVMPRSVPANSSNASLSNPDMRKSLLIDNVLFNTLLASPRVKLFIRCLRLLCSLSILSLPPRVFLSPDIVEISASLSQIFFRIFEGPF